MSRLQRDLVGIALCGAFIVAILTARYFKRPHRLAIAGLIGGLVAWAIYASILWQAVSH